MQSPGGFRPRPTLFLLGACEVELACRCATEFAKAPRDGACGVPRSGGSGADSDQGTGVESWARAASIETPVETERVCVVRSACQAAGCCVHASTTVAYRCTPSTRARSCQQYTRFATSACRGPFHFFTVSPHLSKTLRPLRRKRLILPQAGPARAGRVDPDERGSLRGPPTPREPFRALSGGEYRRCLGLRRGSKGGHSAARPQHSRAERLRT